MFQLIAISSHCGALDKQLEVYKHTLADKDAEILLQQNQIQVSLIAK